MYCTIFGAFGVYEPFLSVFLATVKGFALPQVGFLVAIPPLVGFMSSTTWTTFADAHSSHLTCLFGAGIASIFCMILLWLSSSFIQTALMLALFSFFRAPLTPLLDTTSMRVLRSDTKSYGRLRMFGGLGFGLFAFVVGNLVDWFDFRLMIFCYIFCMSIFVYLVSVLGKIDKSLYKSDSKLQERRIGKRPSILSLLQRRDVLLFVVTEFFLGISHHTITNFLFLYLAGTLGATKTLMGVMIAMSIMSEVPVFYFSPQLISRLGYDKMIIIAHGAVIIRLLAYTLIGTATLALGIQLLHGLTFACMWAAAVVHANALAPPGQEATLQGLLTASFTGLGSATGSILGGIIFQNLGPILLYRMAAAVVVLSLGLFVWGRRKN
ncbi:MFS transporter [Pelomyxa schiedti]|nr:MFS transporter [Pelomyxa schiedti]